MSGKEKEYLLEIIENEKRNLLDMKMGGGELTPKGQKCLEMIDKIISEVKENV